MKFNYGLLKKDIKVGGPVLLVIIFLIIVSEIIMGKICPVRMILGIPCPGCGVTRAFVLVLKGYFYEATVMHPIWILLVILAVAFMIARYFVEDEEQSQKLIKILKKCFLAVIAFSIIFYVYRMIYWFPNRAPMEYDENNLIKNILENLKKLCYSNFL